MTTTTSEKEPLDVLLAARAPAVVLARKRAQVRKRWVKRGLALFVAVAVAAGAVFLAWPKPVGVEVATVRRGPMQVTIEEAGRTRVRDRYVVLAPIGGDLARITLRPGDIVERGGVLARIAPQIPALLDPRTRAEATARLGTSKSAAQRARAEVKRAELAVEHARGDADRMRTLAETSVVNRDDAAHAAFELDLRKQELASARFGAETAAHEVEMANAALARYGDGAASPETFEISSPIAGSVLRVIQPSAGMVAPTTPLVELGDPTEIEVVVDVLTEDAVRIPPRAKVVLDRWGGPWPLDAHVRLVEPSAFTRLSALGVEEQRATVVIDFDEPVERRTELGDGYRVEARIVTWEEDAVLTVPASAAFRRGDGWAVFVAVDGRAQVRPVELGRRGALELQILSGVSEGDEIIVHPSDKVAEGVRIAKR